LAGIRGIDDMKLIGSFECSQTIINQILKMPTAYSRCTYTFECISFERRENLVCFVNSGRFSYKPILLSFCYPRKRRFCSCGIYMEKTTDQIHENRSQKINCNRDKRRNVACNKKSCRSIKKIDMKK